MHFAMLLNLRFLHSQDDSHSIPEESKNKIKQNIKQRKKKQETQTRSRLPIIATNSKSSVKYPGFAFQVLIVNTNFLPL